MIDYTKLCEELLEVYPMNDYSLENAMRGNIREFQEMCGEAADAIEALQAESNDLFYKLVGVMHSVDKWLDGDELEQDEVNRAVIMREKTLRITESLQAENKRLQAERDALASLAGQLIALCNPSDEQRDSLFRRHINRPGDYMGCGYDFLDGFNHIFDEFTATAAEETYRAIRTIAEAEIEKRRGVSEQKADG